MQLPLLLSHTRGVRSAPAGCWAGVSPGQPWGAR